MIIIIMIKLRKVMPRELKLEIYHIIKRRMLMLCYPTRCDIDVDV